MANVFPEVDLFASYSNHKCNKYFSASPDPNAVGVDALAHSWNSFQILYAFPPSHLINKVLYKFLNSSCKSLLLLVPRSATGWHKNLRRLSPIEIPFRFSKDDFHSTTQIDTVHSAVNQYNLIA